MKNIHILPTDKPSRLLIKEKSLLLVDMPKNYTFFGNIASINIYITSDEEITNCDCYVINVVGEISRRTVFKPIKVTEDIVRKEPLITYPNGGWCKKIILTTDQDLIKDGVQTIDDEFLEWFVKNPSCEEIEIKLVEQRSHLSLNDWVDEDENGKFPISIAGAFCYRKIYKIIIPKEELSIKLHKGEIVDESYPKEFKQETLEEASFRLYPEAEQWTDRHIFTLGAKWQIGKQDNFIIGFLEFIEGTYSYSNIFDYWYLHADTSKTYTKKELLKKYIDTLNGN